MEMELFSPTAPGHQDQSDAQDTPVTEKTALPELLPKGVKLLIYSVTLSAASSSYKAVNTHTHTSHRVYSFT